MSVSAPLGERLADQELELADLVAGLQQPGEVVALDPQLDAELGRQALELQERRGRVGELDARDRRRRGGHPVTISGEQVARQGLVAARAGPSSRFSIERVADGVVAVVVVERDEDLLALLGQPARSPAPARASSASL